MDGVQAQINAAGPADRHAQDVLDLSGLNLQGAARLLKPYVTQPLKVYTFDGAYIDDHGPPFLPVFSMVKDFKKKARKKLEDSTNERQRLFRMQSGSRAGKSRFLEELRRRQEHYNQPDTPHHQDYGRAARWRSFTAFCWPHVLGGSRTSCHGSTLPAVMTSLWEYLVAQHLELLHDPAAGADSVSRQQDVTAAKEVHMVMRDMQLFIQGSRDEAVIDTMQGRPVVKTMPGAMDGPELQLPRWDDTQHLILCNRAPGDNASLLDL
ncbi:hypothetical protein WJX74_004946 [Apatococcus lobatus]|uniref:Uncharacterized protein n=1 Tax=Apatococcus lobatus TaxID=904363 RepID=A0AAW1QIG1_9CHLO